MTIAECLERVKRDRPGEATDDELLKWLSDLDEKWMDEVINTHEISAREYVDARIRGLTKEKLSQEPGLVYMAIRDEDVWFGPISAGEHPQAADWPGFDPKKTAYGAVFHTSDPTAESEIAFSLTRGTEQIEIEYFLQNSDAYVYYADGKMGVVWGSHRDETGYDVISFSLNGYMVTVWRYYDGSIGGEMTGGDDFITEDAPDFMQTQLLIPSPDDEVYIYWLYALIDLRLGEMERYNNDAAMYNNAFLMAAKRYNRSHMPLGRQLRHIVYGSRPVPRKLEDPLDQRKDPFRMHGRWP